MRKWCKEEDVRRGKNGINRTVSLCL